MTKLFFKFCLIAAVGICGWSCAATGKNETALAGANNVEAGSNKKPAAQPQQGAGGLAEGFDQAKPDATKTVEPVPPEKPAKSGGFELRCGWYANPTPGNHWLTDADGEWTLGVQGGHQAEGDFPEFADDQWVKTNGYYGYGCACIRARVDVGTREVLEIKEAYARPLTACKNDPALNDPS